MHRLCLFMCTALDHIKHIRESSCRVGSVISTISTSFGYGLYYKCIWIVPANIICTMYMQTYIQFGTKTVEIIHTPYSFWLSSSFDQITQI